MKYYRKRSSLHTSKKKNFLNLGVGQVVYRKILDVEQVPEKLYHPDMSKSQEQRITITYDADGYPIFWSENQEEADKMLAEWCQEDEIEIYASELN